MITVIGHLEVDPADRVRVVDLSQEAARSARAADGCLHFAVTADPLDPGRVDVAEVWRDRPSLETFRGSGVDGELGEAIRATHVHELETRDTDHSRTPEAEIRAVLDERVRAVATRDTATLVARFADDVDSFAVTPPQRTVGRDPLDAAMRAWFHGYDIGPTYEVHDLRVTSSGSLAVAAFRYRVTGTLIAGPEVDMSVRATAVLHRDEDGRWRLVHQHESVPWDPQTGQGVLTHEG